MLDTDVFSLEGIAASWRARKGAAICVPSAKYTPTNVAELCSLLLGVTLCVVCVVLLYFSASPGVSLVPTIWILTFAGIAIVWR